MNADQMRAILSIARAAMDVALEHDDCAFCAVEGPMRHHPACPLRGLELRELRGALELFERFSPEIGALVWVRLE